MTSKLARAHLNEFPAFYSRVARRRRKLSASRRNAWGPACPRTPCCRDSSLVLEGSHDDLDEARFFQRVPPPADAGGMLTAAAAKAKQVLQQSHHAGGSAAEHLAREAGDHGSVSGLLESDPEHHVAGHEASAGAQDPDRF